MIRLNLEIVDSGRTDAVQLRALSALFLAMAEGNKADQVRAGLDVKTSSDSERVTGAAALGMATGYAGTMRPQLAADVAALDPADNPAAGMPSPSEAFGMGNGAAASGSVSSLSNASTGAGSESAALPDPSQAFGGAGNGQAAPAPSNGPPASPSGTPPISPPGAAGAPAALPTPGPVAPPPAAAPGLAASTSHAPSVELDAEGIPWDASIHASTKVKIANGTWKVKRGTGESYLKERKEVLRAAVAAGGNAATGGPVTPPGNASAPPAAGAGAPPPPGSLGNVPPAAIPSPQASAGTTPAAAGSNGAVTMAQVLPRVTSAITAGLLTVESAAAIVNELSEGKIQSVAMLAVAPALLAPFAARLDLLGIPA